MDLDTEKLCGLPARQRAVEASRMAAQLQAQVIACTTIRREALHELEAEGITRTELARLLGVSITRVSQILAGNPKREEPRTGG